jgi:hypothetical protein
MRDGKVTWGFTGTNNDVREGISVQDAGWLLRYLGRITDDQLRAALRASGADPAETACFTKAVRQRISALQALQASGINSDRSGPGLLNRQKR